MLVQTPTQVVMLVLCVFAGWLLGLASTSGGRKWKSRFKALELEHRRYRTEAERAAQEKDAHIREIEADRDRRIAAIENEHRRNPATAAGTVIPVRTPPGRDAGGSWRDWFGRARDNLSRIEGIDETLERKLNVLGIKSFRDIETLTDDDEAAVEDETQLARGTITRQDWRGQARALRAGGDELDRRRG